MYAHLHRTAVERRPIESPITCYHTYNILLQLSAAPSNRPDPPVHKDDISKTIFRSMTFEDDIRSMTAPCHKCEDVKMGRWEGGVSGCSVENAICPPSFVRVYSACTPFATDMLNYTHHWTHPIGTTAGGFPLFNLLPYLGLFNLLPVTYYL